MTQAAEASRTANQPKVQPASPKAQQLRRRLRRSPKRTQPTSFRGSHGWLLRMLRSRRIPERAIPPRRRHPDSTIRRRSVILRPRASPRLGRRFRRAPLRCPVPPGPPKKTLLGIAGPSPIIVPAPQSYLPSIAQTLPLGANGDTSPIPPASHPPDAGAFGMPHDFAAPPSRPSSDLPAFPLDEIGDRRRRRSFTGLSFGAPWAVESAARRHVPRTVDAPRASRQRRSAAVSNPKRDQRSSRASRTSRRILRIPR